jgi:tRNA (guanine-N7-)-methyltransferase
MRPRLYNKLLDTGNIGLTTEDFPPDEKIDFKNWFGQERYNLPLELEIGAGKGEFIIRQARKVPSVNYIGLEYAKKYFLYSADRARREDLQNIRIVNMEALLFIKIYVCDEVFRQIHIYFPDPWQKRKYNRRRFIQEVNLRELYRILTPGGLIRIMTDHDDYFTWIKKNISLVEDIFTCLPFSSPEAADEGELVGTNFERKCQKKGSSFHGVILKKRDRN